MLLVYVDNHLALEEAVREVVYDALKVVVQVVVYIVHSEVDILLPNQEKDMGEAYGSHGDTSAQLQPTEYRKQEVMSLGLGSPCEEKRCLPQVTSRKPSQCLIPAE